MTELLPGLKFVELTPFRDSRGYFVERYNESRFRAAGVDAVFVQDNHSRSEPNVLRGLHFQIDPRQGKLISVLRGRIWDVCVDLRNGSHKFGKWFACELNEAEPRALWIPHGFAHGFCVLGQETADVLYKVTGPYNPNTEGGIHWDDPTLAIPWPVRKPLVSERDARLPRLHEIAPMD